MDVPGAGMDNSAQIVLSPVCTPPLPRIQPEKTPMRSLFTTLFTLFLLTHLSGQGTISGVVLDAETNEPLIGVLIQLPGPDVAAQSDFNGKFTLEATADTVKLTVSYLGYEKEEVTAYVGETLRVEMRPAGTSLEEVVVVRAARRPLMKADRTSAVRTVAVDDIAYSAPAEPSAYVETGSTGGTSPTPKAGLLTAGEVNDFSKWDMWEDINFDVLSEWRARWFYYPDYRYAVQLTYAGGEAATDLPVMLVDKSGGVIWSARTDNRGRAELWAGLNETLETAPADYELRAEVDGKTYHFSEPARVFGLGLNTLQLPVQCRGARPVDVAFAVDVTGSMGDELRYIQTELQDVIKRATDDQNVHDLRTAAIVYKDSTDDYVTRHQGFADVTVTKAFFGSQRYGGGGDGPEAVDAALITAVDSLQWREDATRLLFLVLDAAPHHDGPTVQRLHNVTRRLAEKGIRLVPVVCSGMRKDGEYLLRSMALATNGTYVFLTDDSGIGNPHLKPTTDEYEVETLNELLARLISTMGSTYACDTRMVKSNDLDYPRAAPENPGKTGDLRAFPNPTAGPVTVKTKAATGLLTVLDANGKLLFGKQVTAARTEIDLGGLASGTYFLRYVTDQNDAVKVARIIRK